jgi:hypothetical protein
MGLLLAAGCVPAGPREEAVLLDSPQERARRDLLVFYYSEADDGTVISVTVPRRGPGESRGELGPEIARFLASTSLRIPPRWRAEDVPVTEADREAMNRIFAGLPAGATERTLAIEPLPRQPAGDLAPDVEAAPSRVRVRILHVSATGVIKTLRLIKGSPHLLPVGGTPAGEAVAALDAMLLRLGNHGLR